MGPRGSPLLDESPPIDESTDALTALVDEQPTRWGGIYGEGDRLVITYVGQTREEALRAIEQRAGSATYIEVRPASVTVSDLKRAKDVVVSVLRDEPEVVMVYPSYSEGSIHAEVTGDAVEAATVLRGKVPGPVRVLVKGGATPMTPA